MANEQLGEVWLLIERMILAMNTWPQHEEHFVLFLAALIHLHGVNHQDRELCSKIVLISC